MARELISRFQRFSIAVRDFCGKSKWDIINKQYIRQVIRSSSAICANYIEASDRLGKADELMKIKTSLREAKETLFFINLILTYSDPILDQEKAKLIDEGQQIVRILTTVILKIKNRK